MTHRILIVDPDAAFAQMLEEILTRNGDYTASAVTSGARALGVVQADPPDMVIVDLSLSDVPPMTLINAMRRVAPGLRVMLIPIGPSLPTEYAGLQVQGILTKPFFVGDLGESIARALGTDPRRLGDLPQVAAQATPEAPARPRVRQQFTPRARGTGILVPPMSFSPPAVNERADVAASPVAQSDPMPRATPRVRQALPTPPRRTVPGTGRLETPAPTAPNDLDSALARLATELRAETAWVVRNGALLAQCGAVPNDRADRLLAFIAEWSRIAGDVAAVVGEARGRFRQLHFEGERFHVYAVEINIATLVIVVCRTDTSIGTIRLALKTAGPDIAKLVPA